MQTNLVTFSYPQYQKRYAFRSMTMYSSYTCYPVRNIKVHVRAYVRAYWMHTYLREQWPDPGAYNGRRCLTARYMRRWMTSIRANGTNQADWPTGIYISAGKSASLSLSLSLDIACLEHRQEIRETREYRGAAVAGFRDDVNRCTTGAEKSSSSLSVSSRTIILESTNALTRRDRSLIKWCNFHESLHSLVSTGNFSPCSHAR